MFLFPEGYPEPLPLERAGDGGTAINRDESGYVLSPETTGLEVALRLNHLISVDSQAKRKRIEERSIQDVERLLEFYPATRELLSKAMMPLHGFMKELMVLQAENEKTGEPNIDLLKLNKDVVNVIERLEIIGVRLAELTHILATSAMTASRESKDRIRIELTQFTNHLADSFSLCLSTLELLLIQVDNPNFKSSLANVAVQLRTAVELIRSINVDEIAESLYRAQEKARQARTALANRDSRVKAVLKAIFRSQGQEPSIVDVKIGNSPEKLQGWLDDVFALFIASRPNQKAQLLQKIYKKEWDIFTRMALHPALSLSDSTSVHESKLMEFFNLSNKWQAQKVTLRRFDEINKLKRRPDFVHESGAELDIKRSAKNIMKMRLNPSDSLAFVFTFPASFATRIDELEFRLLSASRTLPEIGKVEVSSRELDYGDYEVSIEFPATDSFESVEKLKTLVLNVVNPFLGSN